MNKKHKDILNHSNLNASGFKTPDGYFENLETELFEKALSSEENVGSQSLKKIRIAGIDELAFNEKNQGFKVPKDYFEKVEFRLDKSILNKKQVLKVRRLRLISMSIAASILLFFGIKYMNTGGNSINPIVLQNDEIASWMDEDLVSFDTYEIAEAFGDIELEQTLYEDDAVNDYLDFMDIESLIIEN